MKSCTHYPVAAPRSLFVCASLHRPNYLAGQPMLFLLTLLVSLLLLAGGVQAQPFALNTANDPLAAFDAGQRSVPVFVDIDNDCDQDCFVGNRDGNILYYKNVGTASAPLFVEQFNAAHPMNGLNVGSTAKPAFIDIDADGDMDCFVGAGDGTIRAFKNVGTLTAPDFEEVSGPNTDFFDGNPFDGEDVGSNASPAFLDLDGDGDYDCFVARSASNNSILYFRNDRDETSADFNELTGSGNSLSSIDIISNAVLTVLNTDGDSDMDLYVGLSNGTFLYFNNTGTVIPANPTLGPLGPLDVGSGTQYAAPTFVDIDGDGDMDAFSGRNSGQLVYYRNDATIAPRTIVCKPMFLVNLNANGLVTVNPTLVAPNDLLFSSTFTCPNEVTFAVMGTSQNFTCANADNTATLNGNPDGSVLTLRATDAAGNTASCTIPIHILDKTPPTPTTTPLADRTLDLCTVSSSSPSSYPPVPTATDVCGGTVTTSTTSTISSTVGNYPVVWTYSDLRGNTSTQNQIFRVVSNAPPTFPTCPTSPIPQLANGTNPCGYTGTAFTAPAPMDCEAFTVTSSHTPSSFFPVGLTNVTYAATDASGNTGYCNFTVKVTENIPPTVTVTSPACPTSQTLVNDPGVCGKAYSWTAPGFTKSDNCAGEVNVTVNFTSGAVFPIGVNNVVYTATDVSGNTATFCAFTVTVSDNQFPSMTCPVSTTINTAPGTCMANVNVVLPTATDNCAVTSIAETDASFVPLNPASTLPRTQTLTPGASTFRFRASDAANNTVTCFYTITVVDSEKPKFTNCPANVDMQADSNGCTKMVTWTTPTVTDNCTAFPASTTYTAVVTGSTNGTVTSTATATNTLAFNEGTSTVTYTVSDAATPTSNTEVCSFTVRVTNTVAPTITCPGSTVVVSPGANCLYTLAAIAGVANTATSPCDPGKVTYYTSTGTLLTVGTSTLGLGTSTLTARATDASANTSTCTFNLQVVDQTAPTLVSCPSNITVNSSATLCGANPTWTAPVYSDNCSQTITVTSKTTPSVGTPNTAVLLANNSGGFFPVGTTTVNFTAKDSPASTYINISCSLVVTVVDNVAPLFTNCPNPNIPIVISTSAAVCTATYPLVAPTVTDNCSTTATSTVTYTLSGATTLGITSYSTSPSATLNLGNTTIVYRAVDNAPGTNSATCTYVVRVEDRTAPAITCPPNQNIVATSGCSAMSASWNDPTVAAQTVSDNCSGISSISGPTIISGPTPATISATSPRTGTFQAGITVIGYTTTDNAGNTAACTFMIFVKENIAPTIICPANITVSTDVNICTRTLTPNLPGLGSPTPADNCNVVGVTNTLQTTTPSPVQGTTGFYTVTYTVTDASGNTATCAQTITVKDLVPAVITCSAQPYTYVSANGNSCVENGNNPTGSPVPAGFAPPVPTATDNCTGTVTVSRTAGQPGQYCTNTTQFLQWTATDLAGNASTCSQQIIIQTSGCTPLVAPITGCNNSVVTLPAPPGCPSILQIAAGLAGLSAVDNCGNTISITASPSSLPANGVAQSVTFTATVGSNSVTCTKSIIITAPAEVCGNGIDDDCDNLIDEGCGSNPAPVFVGCPLASTLSVNAANCSATAAFTAPATIPAGLAVTTTGASSPFSGTSTITYTASNANGTATCVRTVTVTPTAEVCGNNIDDDCDNLIDEGCSGNPAACPGQKILAGDGAANDYYGYSTSVDGDLAVVGAYSDDLSSTVVNSGSFYVLEHNLISNTWQPAAGPVRPTTPVANSWFGYSVAMDGEYIAVGAPQEAGKGVVYVFRKGATSSVWNQVAQLTDPTGIAGDRFGESVSISGNYVIVGAPTDPATSTGNGSVTIFQRNTTTGVWGSPLKLTASDGLPDDAYGFSVSIDGDYAAVGAPMDDYVAGTRTNAGSVYLLQRSSGNTWTQIAHEHASDYRAQDNYGASVSISGGSLLVGSPSNTIGTKPKAGSVYFLAQDDFGIWSEVENILADDVVSNAMFGISVSLDGDVAAIGAHFDNTVGFHFGSAYLFVYDVSIGWSQISKVTDPAGAMNDNFGYSVGISGTTAIVGSWKKDNTSNAPDQGAVFLFDNCSNLVQWQVENREQQAATPEPAKSGKVLCAPNPATDIINIDVTLAQEEAVRITVCDATGRLVETIFDGKAAAESRFQWDGGRYGRGIYFIRVQSASVTKVVSVTLIR